MAKKNKTLTEKTATIPCFWCEKPLSDHQITKDHLIPKGMDNTSSLTVPCCKACNAERGKVTEIHNHRISLMKDIAKSPERITRYKNHFCKKIEAMTELIVKWEFLHREKGIILPFSLLEVVRLDDGIPLGV